MSNDELFQAILKSKKKPDTWDEYIINRFQHYTSLEGLGQIDQICLETLAKRMKVAI